MSHRWDSHWQKHGRSGPSPFAATPSHRAQWQAQLGRLKQKAAFRKAQQQATQQPKQAAEEPHQASPKHFSHAQTPQQPGQQSETEVQPQAGKQSPASAQNEATKHSEADKLPQAHMQSQASEQYQAVHRQHEHHQSAHGSELSMAFKHHLAVCEDTGRGVDGAQQENFTGLKDTCPVGDAAVLPHHEEPLHAAGTSAAQNEAAAYILAQGQPCMHSLDDGTHAEEIADHNMPTAEKENCCAHSHVSSHEGYSRESMSFQTQHGQVQSQLAGLRRRAARKKEP